jgi:hypothetical protein
MHPMNTRLWAALAAVLIFAFAVGPAWACRVPPRAFRDETPVSVEVTVQTAEYVGAEEAPAEVNSTDLGAWRAVGYTTSEVPAPLDADAITFSGHENFFGCISGYDKPAVGSRWWVFLGINTEGTVRLISLRPVPKP